MDSSLHKYQIKTKMVNKKNKKLPNGCFKPFESSVDGDGDFNQDKKYIIQVGDNLGFIAYF